MVILEYITNSTRLYANSSPEVHFSKHGSGIAERILRVEKISVVYCHQLYFAFQHICSQIINDHNENYILLQ